MMSVEYMFCIETSLEILHILPKGPKQKTTEQYETYKHYKQSPTNVLNDHLHYKTHTLFETIIHASHTNIATIPISRNWKVNTITASSTTTAKH